MSDLSLEQIELFISSAHKMADLSAKEILPYFRREISILHKDGKGIFDPVTDADRNAEKVIRTFIDTNFPDHSIIGEEFGSKTLQSDHCWILDPIDGTRAFVLGSPLWGTLIGLTYKDIPVIGMMNQPFTGERFWATPNGAYARWSGEEHSLKTRSCDELSEAVITTTCPDLFATDNDRETFNLLRKQCRMTRYGGDCYNYCLMAMGRVDLIVESGLATYDIAPLIPLIEQSGGVISTWSGDTATNGGQIVAAGSKTLHEKALKILSQSISG